MSNIYLNHCLGALPLKEFRTRPVTSSMKRLPAIGVKGESIVQPSFFSLKSQVVIEISGVTLFTCYIFFYSPGDCGISTDGESIAPPVIMLLYNQAARIFTHSRL